ncbi:MAG TPA: hypothetical protein DCZ95_06195 [Verrucomicrobia bacterium]|nr:MAG: hypothetical protein A2X46_08390 [Lentisphaerae bacterium GWF2_57_35]HBA83669.1 hypothetical protein [Verrucomicrobiota bacterium]
MNKWMKTYGMMMAGMLMACSAGAEELVFFQSSVAGADAWSWGGAKAKQEADLLTVVENNPNGGYGDVYPSDVLPYIPGARLEFNVSSVVAGNYTLQILCFRGSVYFKTIDVIKDSKKVGAQVLKMSDLTLPPETQSIMFKLWVANSEGASLKLKELKYSMPLAAGSLSIDERFKNIDAWKATDLEAVANDAGISLAMSPDKTFGCLAWEKTIPADKQSFILIHIAEAKSSVISVQLETLDGEGQFIMPVDAIKDVGAGWHGAALSMLELSAETTQYQIKLWMAGGTAAKGRIDRLLILK